jgi:GNAT superfamily N-acetyltransferase
MTIDAFLRLARDADLEILREIDDDAFPKGDPVRKSALDGEIQLGLKSGQILVAADIRTPDIPIAFLQFHQLSDSLEVFVEGVAVAADYQGRGIAAQLLNELTRITTDKFASKPLLQMTISPHNPAMIRSALRAGFIGLDFIPGYFGPGEDRIYFRNALPPLTRLGESVLIPADATSVIESRLTSGYVLVHYETLPQGPSYCLKKKTLDDAAALNANETSVSMSVSASLLYAFAFLLGFGLTIGKISQGLDVLLGFGLLGSAFSMLIYANSSGEMSRLNGDIADRHMQIGNALSEFSGYYVLFFAIPVVVANYSDLTVLGTSLCLLSATGLGAYQFSNLSILDRYQWNKIVKTVVKIVATLGPASAIPALHFKDGVRDWSMASLCFLTFLLVAALFAREVPHDSSANFRSSLR